MRQRHLSGFAIQRETSRGQSGGSRRTFSEGDGHTFDSRPMRQVLKCFQSVVPEPPILIGARPATSIGYPLYSEFVGADKLAGSGSTGR
jgi:hypothetical protein